MYLDSSVYDYRKLEGDEALIMQGYNLAMNRALGFLEIAGEFVDDNEWAIPVFLDIYKQIADKLHDELEESLDAIRTQTTCELMEANLDIYGEKED